MDIRSIDADEVGRFAALATPTDGGATTADMLRDAWADGTGKPEWTLVVEDRGTPVAGLALLAEPIGGGVAELEFRIAAPWVAWGHPDATAAARALLEAACDSARPHAPTVVERRLNAERHADIPRWRELLEAAAFTLFQEKHGFVWTDSGQELAVPSRVRLETIGEVGPDAYAAAMAEVIPGTLDRNDAYYLARCGPAAWGREMVNAYAPGDDDDSWVLARGRSGELIGYVAVGAFDPGVGTIVHIGVAPEHRGRGYVDELLAAAHVAARARGFTTDLSDVDTLNAPMIAAMERNGHRPDARPWHVWSYRRSVAAE